MQRKEWIKKCVHCALVSFLVWGMVCSVLGSVLCALCSVPGARCPSMSMVQCMSDINHYSFYLYLASAYNKVQECIYTSCVSCCCKKWLFQHPLLSVPDLNSAVFTRYDRTNLERYLLRADLTLIKNYIVSESIRRWTACSLKTLNALSLEFIIHQFT